ncbi:hypothetical protein [Rhizobium rhizogenes]|uniref:hypothetical protein n=1 Tax=Rhizobium rhizogenes TaxID=359 RepID=UPI0015748A6E|nr:hypothetical protein [Rhizobium rhizogenes]NTF80539.1 hypothetical protein [Rhizobium rhizogenes]
MHQMKMQLEGISDRLARLAPSHRDPHRFHEEKSELVAELRRLAGMGTAPYLQPTTTIGRGGSNEQVA